MTSVKSDLGKGEFTIVTVAPKSKENPTLRRLKQLQEDQRANWKGMTVEAVGMLGSGLNTKEGLTEHLRTYQVHWNKLLKELQEADDSKPPLITFSPVQEHQLLRDAPPSNIYSKGNFLNHKELLYRVYKTDARLVRSTLETMGFGHTDSHDWNIMWIGSSAQQYLYEGLNQYQRINHFPNSHEITRKDKLCMSLLVMQEKYGKEEFDFIPDTFVLPDEYRDFYDHFIHRKRKHWIIKPSNSSQGKGIYIIDSIKDVPLDEPCVVSEYIQNPLLINGLKFDLRLYVLVTSFEPLRVYIYEEGLARFASEPYTQSSMSSRYSHLTNYSVNKKNEKFVQNTDWRADDVGHKWSLKALKNHLDSVGVDMDLLWSRIYDMVIKTILSMENVVVDSIRKLALHRNNCFDLFGFDVMIDSNLKPWLIEVNLSPSMATEAPLDLYIKGNLVSDAFNLMGLRIFDRRKESMNKVRNRIKARQNQMTYKKQRKTKYGRPQSPQTKKDFSSSFKFREILKETLQEYERRHNFRRIYPTKDSKMYDKYFVTQRTVNKAIFKALFPSTVDLSSPPEQIEPQVEEAREPFSRPKTTSVEPNKPKLKKKDIEQSFEPKKCTTCGKITSGSSVCISCKYKSQSKEGKLVITGDDILMEYISRLMHAIKAINQDSLKSSWKRAIEKFTGHYVWQNSEDPKLPLWKKLESRVSEMRERRKKLNIAKLPSHEKLEEQKQAVIRGFSASQLEGMLRSSTKNVAHEVVSCVVSEEKGVLTEIIRWLAASAASQQRSRKTLDCEPESPASTMASYKPRPNTSGKL